MRAHPAGPLHGEFRHEEAHAEPATEPGVLDPHVWPRNVARAADGAMAFAGVDVRDLAEAYGTPAVLLDEADFRARCAELRDAFAGADVFYAGKAFLSVGVARWIAEEGLGLDVCTGGELAVALRAGFPAERIAFHGNNKSPDEIDRALAAGVGRYVVDSFTEVDRLAAAAGSAGTRARVLVRVTVGVEAHTHEYIATAHEDQKFGFSLASGAAAEAVGRVLACPSLELVGLHSHIGSQIFDTSGFEVSAHRVVGLAAAIRDEHALELPELVLGGGFGIAYLPTDDPLDVADLAVQLRSILERECASYGLTVPRLAVEPGRSIVGPAGVTLYEVGTVKQVEGAAGVPLRTYVSVDGGMSDNIRAALYGSAYTCALVSRGSAASPTLMRVVGKHCESGDVVVPDVWLPSDVEPGDLLAVAATGAYCRSMASNYNYLPRPPVVTVRDGATRVIVRRETEDDLFALDTA